MYQVFTLIVLYFIPISFFNPYVAIPAEFSDAGFYPTQFCVDATTPGSINVEMDTFVQQNEPGCNGTDYAPMSYITAVPPPPNTTLPEFCIAPLPGNMTEAPAPAPASSSSPSPSPSSKPPSSPAPTTAPASWAVAPSLALVALLGGVFISLATAGLF